jgi:phosphatidylglycerophosphate synthase
MPFVGRFAAGLALLALVAAASTSRFDSGGRLASSPAGYVVLGVAAAVVIAVVLFWLALGGFAARVDMQRSTRLMLVGTVGAIVLAACAMLFLPHSHGPLSSPGRDSCGYPPSYYERHHIDFAKVCGSGTTYAGKKLPGTGGGSGDSTVALALAAGASFLTLIVLATAIVMAMRRRRSSTPPDAEDAGVVQALDESLDDLRRERDVRRAIVACYARMERALAGAGNGRRAHETPLEFLRRALERVAQQPGQVLTDLFERARFSVEPMGESEKRSAIAALEQLRAEVAG